MSIPLVYSDFEFAKYPPERQFHILKHLSAIDPDYREQLISHHGYADNEIDGKLNERGSKFSESFCRNPLELLDVLKEEFHNQKIQAWWHDESCEFQIRFAESDFPCGIGDDRVIALREVPDLIKKPFMGKDFETLQSIVYRTAPKLTWRANVILQVVDGEPEVMSVFPGIYAPPFPDREEQSEQQYEQSLRFWCNHIIIS